MEMALDLARAMMATTPERWVGMAKALPAELLEMRPADQEWSPVECLLHMIDSEKVYQFRVQAFLAGKDYFPNFDPDSQGSSLSGQTPLALAEEFARLRNESLRMLETLSPSDLERKARHGELGMVTFNEMVNNWAGHDLNHTVQAERALMQPFIRGCGPWRKYYTDHIVGN